MYIPSYFRVDDLDLLMPVMQEFSFATLVTQKGAALEATHLPLIVDREGEGVRIFGHVARGNSQWHAFDGKTEALVMFQGPHSYISPSWYINPVSVPTWNYAAVHVTGVPRIIEEYETVVPLLKRLVDKYEGSFADPWPMDLPTDYLQGMVKAIVAFEIMSTRIEGKFKMNQNRTFEDQAKVITTLEQSAEPLDRRVGQMMRELIALNEQKSRQ